MNISEAAYGTSVSGPSGPRTRFYFITILAAATILIIATTAILIIATAAILIIPGSIIIRALFTFRWNCGALRFFLLGRAGRQV